METISRIHELLIAEKESAQSVGVGQLEVEWEELVEGSWHLLPQLMQNEARRHMSAAALSRAHANAERRVGLFGQR